MGEIKSTLDLVLERTRHLSLSPAEREAQRQREARGRIGGLLQQLLDQRLAAAEAASRLQGLLAELGLTDRTLVLGEAVDRIDPDADGTGHRRLFEVLRTVCGVETEGLARLLANHREIRDRAAGRRTDELRQRLAEGGRIAGTAVVPNLAADLFWRDQSAQLRKACVEKLAAEGTRLRDQMAPR